MKPKEAQARIKINKLLEESGWRFFDDGKGKANIVLEPNVKPVPPKYSVAQVVGFIKGKSAIHTARTFMNRRKNFTGENFWARGY